MKQSGRGICRTIAPATVPLGCPLGPQWDRDNPTSHARRHELEQADDAPQSIHALDSVDAAKPRARHFGTLRTTDAEAVEVTRENCPVTRIPCAHAITPRF
jgi:hypothetical protein